MRAKTRRAVVAAAGFDSSAVELVDGGSVGRGESHMNGTGRGFPFPDPEISTALDGEPRSPRALHYLHSERLEGPFVEGAAASHVTYSQRQVVDEGKRHGQRHALNLRARPRGNIAEPGAAKEFGGVAVSCTATARATSGVAARRLKAGGALLLAWRRLRDQVGGLLERDHIRVDHEVVLRWQLLVYVVEAPQVVAAARVRIFHNTSSTGLI